MKAMNSARMMPTAASRRGVLLLILRWDVTSERMAMGEFLDFNKPLKRIMFMLVDDFFSIHSTCKVRGTVTG